MTGDAQRVEEAFQAKLATIIGAPDAARGAAATFNAARCRSGPAKASIVALGHRQERPHLAGAAAGPGPRARQVRRVAPLPRVRTAAFRRPPPEIHTKPRARTQGQR
jgi:hypothetical protein